MVGIVSGSTLGLFNTSLFTLGTRGNLGSAGMGAGSEAVRLNVATGNLVLQHGDDLLAAQGLDFRLLRTYNSQGQWDDDNGDNWRMGPARRVRDGGLAGRNQAGATAWHVAEDGSESVFTYDPSTGRYRSTDGDGAYDTLAWDAATGRWTFTDGDSRATEVYAADADGGVLLSYTDSNGLATQYSYVAGRLAQVVDASGQTTSFVYDGANLVEVRVARGELSATPVSTVRYEYDTQNRLRRVVTDLTPADGSISDGNTYWVRYGYDGSSTRVSLVEQKDGSRLAIGYVQTGSGAQGWRVSSLTDALDRVTRFAYDTVARTATVTSPLGLQTVYSYDAQARLTGILEPAVGGRTALTTLAYDTDGNLLSVQDALGRQLSLAYDSQGRLVQQRDAAGHTLRRTYDAAGLLATETVFAQPDPDGAGPAAPTAPLTRRYLYDAQRNLRFEISAEGHVTEHRYDAQGQRSASLQYTAAPYPVAGLATEAVPTLAQLQTWSAQANPTQRQLTEYRYDARGLLQQMARYATLAADGSGVLDAQALVTTYVHDSYGRLLQTLTHNQQQTFTYDGLGRLLVSTDALGRQVSVSQYDDANQRSITTLLGGLVRTSVFNATGELITVTEGSAAAADLGTTRYFYDAAGRLRMSLSPAGQASHMVYDERGRKVADIDADGHVTRYVFDDAGQLVQTVRHATPVDPARLVTANGEPAALTLAGLNLASAPDDRHEWALYDTAGRLVRTVDAEGAITDHAYDGASRQVAVTRYAAPLANLAALRSGPATLANTHPPSLNPAADRLTRSFYDGDGRLRALLDAEGHLSENVYDTAGRLVETRRHAGDAPAGSDLRTGTLDSLRPGASDSLDLITRHQYDAAGRLVATRDAEGYLTTQVYDRSGNLAARTRHATAVSGFTPNAAPAEDQTWTYRYNALNQLQSQTDPDGTVTTHQYDDAGRLIASERGWQTLEVRRQRLRHDVQGRVSQELAPEHAALLSAASTPQEIDAVFAAYATTYTYDRDGHRTSVRNAKGQTSFLYYDDQGRLAYTVSAVGEVQRLRYNAFDQLESSTQFAQHLGSAARNGLTGGASTTALRALFDGLANASRDAVTVTHYSATGRVASVQDAEGYLALSQYNSFGELSLARQQIDATGTRWQERSHTYDRRGLLTTTTADPGGRALATVNEYDAFGRVQSYTDENRHLHRTAYDRLGRVVETQDPLAPARLSTYDAFGRVRTQRDALGHVTAYEYHLAERSLTIRSADGTADQVTTRITYNRHGQQYQVTDARSRNTTTYEYDSAGRVTRVSDTLGTVQTTAYDPLVGTVHETTDANGVVTRYSYDAVQRVQLRVVDPAGVAATTSYVYGEDQRTLRETGPDGVVTLTRYDRRGQVASVTVDPDGPQALVTEYHYDGAGRTLAVTDPNGHRRSYEYDTLGRRTSETVDPEHLRLTTLYAYDDRGNLTQRTDPRGHATRFAYDEADRLVFTIDALGGVTELRYDNNSQVVARIAYAQAIPTAWGSAPGVADVRAAVLAVADATKDRVEQSYFDALGRVRFTLDSSGAVSEQRFDPNGNVERRLSYAATWTGPVPASTQALADALRDRGLADPAHDRLEVQFFDARNRVTHRVDGAGGVTGFGYDAAGHVVESLAYATPIANPQALTDLASLTRLLAADPAHDAHSRHVYDTAGRLVASATAQQLNAQGQLLWAVQQLDLDPAGRVATSTRRASFLAGSTLPATPTQEQVRAWIASVSAAPAQDSVQRFVYDSAGRLVYNIDATGAVTRSVYDDAGNIVQRVSYVKPVSLTGRVAKPDEVETALGTSLTDPANRSTLAIFDAANRQRLAIDALGHVTSFDLDARGNPLATTRHARAADTRAWTLDRGHEALAADPDFTQWLAASAATGQDRVERSVYDALDRSTHSMDALGFVKRRDYDALGRLVAGVAFAQSLASHVAMAADAIDTALGVTPQGGLPASARVERFEYDSRGLLVRSTDAEGRSERFSHDGVGNKREFFNKAGALWTYDYDAAGRLLAEKTPQVEVASITEDGQGLLGLTLLQAPLETRLAYDALGRLTQRTEAFGLPGARTTTYGYDAAGRQVRVTYPAVAVYTPESQQALLTNGFGSAAVRVEQTRTLSTQTRYDALGRAVVDQDLGGNYRYRSYDAAGQLAYEVDAEGAVTGYRRNAFGEVLQLTRYAQAIGDLPARAGQAYTQADLDAVYRPAGNPLAGRTLQFVYDLAGHQLKTIEPEVLVYDPTRVGAAGSVVSAGRTTEQTFNAFGEVTHRSVYGQGGQGSQAKLTSTSSVYLYYSRKGEVIGELTQVKAEQAYLTRRFYDAVGNLEDQFEYATAVSGNDAQWSAAASPDDLGLAARAPEDRHTSWAYDKTNRKLSETRHLVLHSQAGSSGITTARANLSTHFGYDAVGNQSRVTDALGASTYTHHDVLGRVTAVVAPAVPDITGTFIRPLTRLRLDAYGNVVEQVAYAGGAINVSEAGYTAPAASAMDRRTLTRYDSHGHVVQVLDATGASSQRSYDEFGRVAKEWRSFTDADGRVVTSFQQYRYDKVGRQVAVLTPASTAVLVPLSGQFTVAIEARSQAVVQPTWSSNDNVSWQGTNTVRLGFPALAAGTTLQVELRYRTGEYGTPGAPSSAVAEERSKVFELASADGRSVLLSWTDSQTHQGLSEVLGFVVRVRDARGQWVTQHDARQELIGLDKAQIEQRSQLAAGVVAETLQFNAFGEVEKKRRNGQVVEQYDYNAAGQVWRSFSGNGVWHGLLHDVDGHVTADIRSADPDRLRVALDETEIAGLRVSQTTTETRYDLMGRVVAQVLPSRSAAAQAGSRATPAMLTWTLKTGSEAQADDDAYTRYGQGPIYRSTGIFSSLLRYPTRIDLQWASLAALGSGDVEVQVDYTDTQSSQRTEVQRFRAEDAQGGATLYWTAPAVASVIHRVRVKKKDAAGEWVTVLDRASQGTYGSRVVFQGPNAVDAAVTLKYRLQGSSAWAEASVAAGTLKNFGNAYLFAPTDALSGTYEYELWAVDTGQTVSTLRDKGSMTLASTAIAVGGAATLAGAASSVLSWADPGSTQTQVFHYRLQGSRHWQSLAVNTVATGRKGVDLKTLPDGIYEYELLYYAAGQSGTPNAHATGVFTTRAARAAGQTLANVDAIAQPLGVAAHAERWIEWARPATDVEVQFSVRLTGASAWTDLPARAVGTRFRVDASLLTAGTYEYSVTYKNPVTHVALSSAGGTLTVQANGSARIVPVTGYIPATQGPLVNVSSLSASEEEGYAVFRVGLSAASASLTRLELAVYGGTAGTQDFGTDLQVSMDSGLTWQQSRAVNLAAGQTGFLARTQIFDDHQLEANERFYLTATRTIGSTTNEVAAGMAVIQDNDDLPRLSASNVVVAEDGGVAYFTVLLSRPVDGVVTVGYRTADQTALAGQDYTGVSGVLSFAPGVTRQTVAVPITDDNRFEAYTEAFRLQLHTPVGAQIADEEGAGTIADDEPYGGPLIAVSIADVVQEGSYAQFDISLSGPTQTATTLNLELYGGDATAGTDYSAGLQVSSDGGATWANASSGVIAAGQTTLKARVQTLNDGMYEGNESFSLRATRSGGRTTNTMASTTAMIVDSDPVPTLSVAQRTVNESAGTVSFTVTLSNASTLPVTVNYATVNGTALAGADYVAKSGSLSFAPGVTSQTVTITLLDDARYEGSESFSLVLGGATNAGIATGTATATLLDNEGLPVLGVNTAAANEGGYLVWDLSLGTASATATGVTLALDSSNATAGVDYVNTIEVSSDGGSTWASATSTSFAAGQTALKARVRTLDDGLYEGIETLLLTATRSSGSTANASAFAYGGLLDNESVPVLTVTGMPVTEGGDALFQIDLLTPSATATTLALSLHYADAAAYGGGTGTAASGADFSGALEVSTDGGATWSAASSVTLAAGQTRALARLHTVDDAFHEGAEGFALTATRTAGSTASPSATGVSELRDNDAAPTFSLSDTVVNEGSYAVFNAELSAASGLDTSFSMAVYGGTAGLGSDVSGTAQVSTDGGATWATATSATIAAGQTRVLIRVATVQDNLHEGHEAFTLQLTRSTGSTANAGATATATVVDDEPVPVLTLSDATVNENAGTVTFTVSLSGPSANTVTVTYSTADASAVAGNDYTAKSGTLSFAPGVTSQTVTVSLLDDAWYEGSESFTLNLGTATGAQFGDASGLATVLDNEGPPSLSIGSVTVNETAATATFTVTLSTPSVFGVTVNYSTADGSATAGADYTARSGQLSFAPGVTSQTVTINLLDDAVYEGAENFSVVLSGAVNAGIAAGSGNALVADSEAAPTLSVSSSSVTEGGYAVFQIDLSTASAFATGLSLNATEVYGGSAVAGVDFSTAVQVSTDGGATWSNGSSLTLAAGQTRAHARVLTLDDNLFEGTEDFQLIATRTTGTTANASASSYGGILDNEITPSLSISSLSVAEGSYAVFNVDLSAANTTATSFGFGAYGGSAAAGSDFGSAQVSYDGGSTWASASVATLAAGQTRVLVRVATVQDNLYEGNESFTLGLTLIEGTSSNAGASGTATVVDDEALPSLTLSDATVNETAGTATFTVSLSGPSATAITAAYSTANLSATTGNDYTGKSGTLTFNPGVTSQTITIALLDDATYEGTETFGLNLGTVSGATVADGAGLATVLDNESVPSLSVGNLTVNENAGTASFTVSLSNATTAAVTVNYATANGSATAGADYTAKSGTLTFNPGVTSQTVTITLLDDSLFEGTETFGISLSGAANAGIATGSATATLLDNDAVPTLSVSNTPVTEGGYAVFQIDLSTASAAATSLSLSAAEVYGGNAVAGVDFSTAVQVSTDGGATWSSGSGVTLAAGQTRAYARVQTLDDNYFEGNESFQLIATRTAGSTANASASSYGGILDNDTTPSLSISSLSVAEGSYAVFNVDLSAANTTATSFGFGAYGGSAAAGGDFGGAQVSYDGGSTWTSASIATMAAGQTRVLVRVPTVQDNLYEGNESFTLGLTLISGTSTNTGASGTATVIDDEAVPSLSVSDATVNENAGTATFTVSLSGPSAGTITVAYGSANGSATSGNDYTAKSGTLTFNPGVTSQTVTVSLLDDAWYEGSESFALNLGTVSGATIADGSGLATLLDNEAFPNASIGNVSVNETAGTATFTVSLSNASAATVTLNYATANGSATAGADYTAKSGSLTFNPGVTSQTVTIDLLDDAWYEGTESFSVGLSAAVNANIATASASATMVDNEAVPTFTVGNASVSEGGYAVFQIDLSTASATATGLSLALAAGSAGANVDYNSALQVSTDGGSTWSAGSSLTLAAGQTRAYARVLTLDDTWYEGNESFQLTATRIAGSTTNASVTASATLVENEAMPTLVVSNASVAEGGYAVFNVDLSTASSTATSVNLAATAGSAAAGTDFTNSTQVSYDGGSTWATATAATLAAGQTRIQVRLATVQDGLYEGNEAFTLTATRSAGTTTNTSAAGSGTVIDDEPFPTLAVNDATVNETAGTVTFTISLSVPSAGAVTVAYTTANGSAAAGSDYTARSGTLTFNPGVTSQTLTVSLLDDTTFEGTESFALNLANAAGANIADASGLATLLDNESTPSMSIGAVTVNENAGTATFTVSLSNATTAAVTVNYATANGNATAGADYTAKSGTLSFAPGVTSQTISIGLLDDAVYEAANETFSVSLSGAANASIATASATATVVDNEGVPGVRISDVTIGEAGGAAVFTITLSNASVNPVSVSYATANGTAYGGSDFTATSGTLSFAAGQTSKTVSVNITNDTKYETSNAEYFYVNLSALTGGSFLDSQGQGFIVDNDAYGAPGVTSVSAKATASLAATANSASTLSAGAEVAADPESLSAYGGGFGATGTTPALPFLEAVIVGTVSWDVPPGAASASFRYRREGSVDWIASDAPMAAGRMSAFIDSPGYGTVEYDVNFFRAGEDTPFAYAAGTVMMGNGEPVLTQSVGPRTRTVATAAQTAQYSTSATTFAGGVAISLPDTGLASAALASTSAGPGALTPEIRFELDRWGNQVAITDARSAEWVTRYAYNGNNQLIQETRPDASTSQTFYDALGRQLGTQDALGHVNTQTLDAAGHVLAEQHADGGVVSHTYDAFGDRRRTVDAEGRPVEYSYDAMGRLVMRRVTDVQVGTWVPINQANGTPQWQLNVNDGVLAESYRYDESGHRIAVTRDAGGASAETVRYRYDARGNVIEVLQPLGQAQRFSYDEHDLKSAEVDANGYYNRWDFDDYGRLASSTELSGDTLAYQYDGLGNLAHSSRNHDGTLLDTWYSYDNAGQVLRVADEATGTLTEYAYDAAGRHVQERTTVGGTVVGPDIYGGAATTYSGGSLMQDNTIGYDALGRVRVVQDGRHFTSMEYDAAGNRIHMRTRYANDNDTRRDYDYWFSYDAMNRQLVVDGVRDQITGRIDVSIDQGHRLSYDRAGNRLSDTTYGRHALLYTPPPKYDQYGGEIPQAAYWKTEAGYTTERYSYDAANRLVHTERDGIDVDTRLYDAASRVVRSGPAPTAEQRVLWTNADNHWDVPAQARITRFDANGRTTAQDLRGLDGSFIQSVGNYRYDAAGNVLRYQLLGNNVTNTYDTTYERIGGAYKQTLQRGRSTQLEEGNTRFAYNAAGHLTSVVDARAAVNNRQFATDLQGRILEKTSYTDESGRTVPHRERTLVVNGEEWGTSGDDKTEKGRSGVDGTRRDGAFSVGYRKIDGTYPNVAPSSYTVSDGDTLQSIAKAIYGDAAQWYRIAEANGLNLDTPLVAGQALVLPSVVGSANNAGTVNPYDPLSRIGDTNPTMPAPPPSSDGGCGVLGQILIIVIVVVVTVYTAGAASGAVGTFGQVMSAGATALGGGAGASLGVAVGSAVAGNIAGQVAANAMGMQDGFSWKSLALSAITAGVGQATGLNQIQVFDKANTVGNVMVQSALSNALNQGTAILLHMQEEFNWKAVAASAIAAPLAKGIGKTVGSVAGEFVGKTAGKVIGDTVGGIARQAIVKSYSGGRFNLVEAAVDSFGNALGESIASAASQPSHAEQMSRQIQAQAVGSGFAAASLQMLAESGDLTAERLRTVLAKGIGDDRAAIMVAMAETYGPDGLRQLAEQQSQRWLEHSEAGFTLAGAVLNAGGLDPSGDYANAGATLGINPQALEALATGNNQGLGAEDIASLRSALSGAGLADSNGRMVTLASAGPLKGLGDVLGEVAPYVGAIHPAAGAAVGGVAMAIETLEHLPEMSKQIERLKGLASLDKLSELGAAAVPGLENEGVQKIFGEAMETTFRVINKLEDKLTNMLEKSPNRFLKTAGIAVREGLDQVKARGIVSEELGKFMMDQSGLFEADSVHSVQNNSGHGIDILAKARFGRDHGKWIGLEVKNTTGTAGDISFTEGQKAGADSFVRRTLNNAANRNGAPWWPWESERGNQAQAVLREMTGKRFDGYVLEVTKVNSPDPKARVYDWDQIGRKK